MSSPTILFQLRTDAFGAYDASATGLQVDILSDPSDVPVTGVKRTGRTRVPAPLMPIAYSVARNASLDHLQSFGLEATVTLETPEAAIDAGAGKPSPATRCLIASSETPGLKVTVDDRGKLFGSVHFRDGWAEVDSGRAYVPRDTATQISFFRAADGTISLEMDGQQVGMLHAPGELVPSGKAGLIIGAAATSHQTMRLEVSSLVIRDAPLDSRALRATELAGKKLLLQVREKSGLSAVEVHVLPQFASTRLRQIKDLMQAVGVNRLSDLGQLTLTSSMTITPGKVILGPRAPAGIATLDWQALTRDFVSANATDKVTRLSQLLPNRNSAKLLAETQQGGASIVRVGVGNSRIPTGARQRAIPLRLRREASDPGMQQMLDIKGEFFALNGASLAERASSFDPSRWIGTADMTPVVVATKTIPTDSAVMMAPVIDLTNVNLVIDAAVSTFYVIANKLICGDSATITWARPTSGTPGRADNADLNGRTWHGVHTSEGSRHGLRGGDGDWGQAGADGAGGRDAPNLEIWSKDLTGMPNLDLNGANGAVGGVGQHGGEGGHGADGHVGRQTCFFACWCSTDAGDGGDGGDGGNGGSGGRGGRGGMGGKVLISVLEGTLEATVKNRAFKIKNQGGIPGRGGDGGSPGNGGGGGRSGNGEECKNAADGHGGARGQPGARGEDGAPAGADGTLTLSVFSLAEWDDLLRRPWLTEVTPKDAFPSDTLTLRGSLFLPGDLVLVGGRELIPRFNADQSVSVTVPADMSGGLTKVWFRRVDGTESNRYNVGIKPQLDVLPPGFFAAAGATILLTGHGFIDGAAMLIDGHLQPAVVDGTSRIAFTMPGTGGGGSVGGAVILQVRNPDGLVSNSRSSSQPRILELPFRTDRNGLAFRNFTQGAPSWATFEDTFGAAEVWHELLDPVFGHPVLTGAYFAFYTYFLKGEGHGGLATGFCTAMSSLVADKFWKGETDTPTLTEDAWRTWMTAVHGRLLSRESLLCFHDQGRQGDARVEITARAIERTLLTGCDRNNAPLLFFIPSGEAWDVGYFDKLKDSHCIMPYRFVYPAGHPGPTLSADGSTTTTDLDGVEMYCWDCNNPYNFDHPAADISAQCRLVFHRVDSGYQYEYRTGNLSKFATADGITLGMMTLGDYLLADHDLPFGGQFGLTRFVVDFLLSPADLQIIDGQGNRTGNFGGKQVAEIADSHPCYLLPGAYLLPADTPLTRRIVGNGSGTYAFNSILPDGRALVLEGLSTEPGEVDILSTSADGTQIRFEPEREKSFTLTLSCQVGKQSRAISISGVGGGPQAGVDITLSPELSLTRVGNRGGARQLQVKAFSFDENGRKVSNSTVGTVAVGTMQDVVVAVQDWKTLVAVVDTVDIKP